MRGETEPIITISRSNFLHLLPVRVQLKVWIKKKGGEGGKGRKMDERSSLIYKNLINRCHGNMPVEGCFDD